MAEERGTRSSEDFISLMFLSWIFVPWRFLTVMLWVVYFTAATIEKMLANPTPDTIQLPPATIMKSGAFVGIIILFVVCAPFTAVSYLGGSGTNEAISTGEPAPVPPLIENAIILEKESMRNACLIAIEHHIELASERGGCNTASECLAALMESDPRFYAIDHVRTVLFHEAYDAHSRAVATKHPRSIAEDGEKRRQRDPFGLLGRATAILMGKLFTHMLTLFKLIVSVRNAIGDFLVGMIDAVDNQASAACGCL
jgi:hypothetical protein